MMSPPSESTTTSTFIISSLDEDDGDEEDNIEASGARRIRSTLTGTHGTPTTSLASPDRSTGCSTSSSNSSLFFDNTENADIVVVDVDGDQEDGAEKVRAGDDENEEDEEDAETVEGQQGICDKRCKKKNKKKKKKQKKNKQKSATKASSSSPVATATIVTSVRTSKNKKNNNEKKIQNKHHVHFGHVHVYQFERCLGEHVVPLHGGWPLGLAYPKKAVSVPADVDVYERNKQERLRERWIHFLHTKKNKSSSSSSSRSRSNSSSSNESASWTSRTSSFSSEESMLNPEEGEEEGSSRFSSSSSPPLVELETRQWDYKNGIRNPLFGVLYENERMDLLLGSSISNSNNNEGNTTKNKGSSNSSSGGGSGGGGGGSRGKKGEHFNATFTQARVHHVRNELEQLRVHRDQRGCDCRKLHVYIPSPPSDDASQQQPHKKSNNNKKRLSLHRVKEELRKRKILPSSSMSREDLELLLAEAVDKEPCCRDDSCPCAQNGIECQENACDCWKPSHHHPQLPSPYLHPNQKANDANDSDSALGMTAATTTTIRERCGNRRGMVTVDWNQIDEWRAKFLFCQEIKINS